MLLVLFLRTNDGVEVMFYRIHVFYRNTEITMDEIIHCLVFASKFYRKEEEEKSK